MKLFVLLLFYVNCRHTLGTTTVTYANDNSTKFLGTGCVDFNACSSQCTTDAACEGYTSSDDIIFTTKEELIIKKANGTMIASKNFHNFDFSGFTIDTIVANITSVNYNVLLGGNNQMALLKADGTVVAKGYPNWDVVSILTSMTNVNKLFMAGGSVFVQFDNGTFVCAGNNQNGKLGLGDNVNVVTPVPCAIPAPADMIVKIKGTASHTAILLSTGHILNAGSNYYYALGRTWDTGWHPEWGTVDVSNVVDMCQTYHGCAVMEDGTVKCWGHNNYGQVGDSSTTNRQNPEDVSIENVKNISCSDQHTCALLHDGTMKCWGYGYLYCLGQSDTSNKQNPQVVPNVANVIQIHASYGKTYILLADGAVHKLSQSGSTATGIVDAVVIGGADYGVCAILRNNTIQCFETSSLNEGEIATETNDYPLQSFHTEEFEATIPPGSVEVSRTTVSGMGLLGDVIALQHISQSSYAASCALSSDGIVTCWGKNGYGQLGDGTKHTTIRSYPKPVVGVTNAIKLVTASYSFCALLGDGTVKCWGYLYEGLVCASSSCRAAAGCQHYSCREEPFPVAPPLTGVVDIVSTSYNYCVLLQSGKVQCIGSAGDVVPNGGYRAWGYTDIVENAVSIHGAPSELFAVLSDGTVACTGANSNGECGTGSYTDRSQYAPLTVKDVSDAKQKCGRAG